MNCIKSILIKLFNWVVYLIGQLAQCRTSTEKMNKQNTKIPDHALIGELDLKTKFVWGDDFAGDGPIDATKWRFEPMTDGMHQVGNVFDGKAIHGLRHVGVYGEYTDELCSRKKGMLQMGLCVETTPNEYRKNVTGPDDFEHCYGDCRIHVPWIDTRHLAEFGPGHVLEGRFCFEGMKASGGRISFWGMPNKDKDGNEAHGNAYNADAASGMEADYFEYDPGLPYHLQCKLIGGKSGQTPKGSIDLRNYGIDLTVGFHIITVARTTDFTVWMVNGVEILRDEKHIPLSSDYIILSMEVNSGAKPDPKEYELQSDPPFLPNDPGLYAKSIIQSGIDNINQQVCLVDYIGVFEIV